MPFIFLSILIDVKIGYRYFKTKVDQGVQVMLPLDILFRKDSLPVIFPNSYTLDKGFISDETWIGSTWLESKEYEILDMPAENLVKQKCWITLGFPMKLIPSKYLSDRGIIDLLSLSHRIDKGYVTFYGQVYFGNSLDFSEIFKRTTTKGWMTLNNLPEWGDITDDRRIDKLISQFKINRNWRAAMLLDLYVQTRLIDLCN